MRARRKRASSQNGRRIITNDLTPAPEGIWGCVNAIIMMIAADIALIAGCATPEPLEPIACTLAALAWAGAATNLIDQCLGRARAMMMTAPIPLILMLVSMQGFLVIGIRKFATRKRGGFPDYALILMAIATALIAITVIPGFSGPLLLRAIVSATAIAASVAWFAAWRRLRIV